MVVKRTNNGNTEPAYKLPTFWKFSQIPVRWHTWDFTPLLENLWIVKLFSVKLRPPSTIPTAKVTIWRNLVTQIVVSVSFLSAPSSPRLLRPECVSQTADDDFQGRMSLHSHSVCRVSAPVCTQGDMTAHFSPLHVANFVQGWSYFLGHRFSACYV